MYYVDGEPQLCPDNVSDPDGMKRIELSATGIEPKKWKRFLFSSKVHASYAKLAGYESANATKLPAEIKAKMWCSHYQDFVLDNKDMYGNFVDWEQTLKEDGFAGKVVVGQVFEL